MVALICWYSGHSGLFRVTVRAVSPSESLDLSAFVGARAALGGGASSAGGAGQEHLRRAAQGQRGRHQHDEQVRACAHDAM